MRKFLPHRVGICVLAIILLWSPLYQVHAQIFTDEQIQEQEKVVLVEFASTLEEQLKLVQMLFINQLKARLTELQNQSAE
jgi:hypothetical protein